MVTCLWASLDPLGYGHYILALSLFFLSFSLSLVCLPGFRGVKFLVHCGAGNFSGWLSACGLLAVRLRCSRPKLGGLVWLAVRARGLGIAVDLLLRWLFAPGGLLLQLAYFSADCSCLSVCYISVPVCSVNWFVSLLRLSSCLFSELICKPAASQFPLNRRIDLSA